MKKLFLNLLILMVVVACSGMPKHHHQVGDNVIDHQRHMLAKNTAGKGFGPQAPRDINSRKGKNARKFTMAPSYKEMNLCNIHFHKNAEHKGGEFTTYAGNGDGHGYLSGYKYNKKLPAKDMKAVMEKICPSAHGDLSVGDTIEVHYVYSSAQVKPGPTLGSCISEEIKNPALRVEALVFVLANNKKALDFTKITEFKKVKGLYQAPHLPSKMGKAVNYIGSTTGPGYNEIASPFHVTWSVRPKVVKVDIQSVGKWCKGNAFNEDHAHGVRNLVVNPDLLSRIK